MVLSRLCFIDSAAICMRCWFLFFFFKQKTAYEIQYGLVGSEMCIRDRIITPHFLQTRGDDTKFEAIHAKIARGKMARWIIKNRIDEVGLIKDFKDCLLYTSDAADERSRVNLGGRRIIKKNKKEKKKKEK